MKSKRILILSDPPAPPGFLPRLRYMCDFLVRKGYDITLLTEKYEPLMFEYSYPIEVIPMYSGSTLDWAVKTAWTLVSDWHDRVFAKRAIKVLQERKATFDLVLCSAFSDFPLGAAKRIADRYAVPLLCDIRDLDEQVDNSTYQYHHRAWWIMPFRKVYRAIHLHRRNNILRQADAITTVSPWHVDFIKQFNPNVHLVYNGYDEKQFYPDSKVTDQFRITYIGSLFEWQQSSLELIKQIAEELHLTLDIHTPQHLPVRHEMLGDTIRNSSIMLVFTNPNTHGMLTTKFYEALGCAKPVLCVPSDQGALAELIRYTNAGIATDDKEQIYAFIQRHLTEWQQNGFTQQHVQHREDFSRNAQCTHMESIIQHLI